MVIGGLCLFVMKYTQASSSYPVLASDYRTVDIVGVTILVLAAMFMVMVVLTYPVIAAGTVIVMHGIALLDRRAFGRLGSRSLRAVLLSITNTFARNVMHVHRSIRRA